MSKRIANVLTMTPDGAKRDSARAAFSERLNKLLDHYSVPAKHAGRQVIVKDALGVSQEASRKWLEGEAIPRMDKLKTISEKYPCQISWLQNDEGPMLRDPEREELLALWEQTKPEQRLALLTIMRSSSSTKA